MPGNNGGKFLFEVEYLHSSPDLHTRFSPDLWEWFGVAVTQWFGGLEVHYSHYRES